MTSNLTKIEIQELVDIQFKENIDRWISQSEYSNIKQFPNIYDKTLLERIVRVEEELKYLHILIKERFESIDKRFELVEKRFDSIDKRFEIIDKRFETIDKRFEAIDKRFDSIDKRFEEINKNFRWAMGTIIGIMVPFFLGIYLKLFFQ